MIAGRAGASPPPPSEVRGLASRNCILRLIGSVALLGAGSAQFFSTVAFFLQEDETWILTEKEDHQHGGGQLQGSHNQGQQSEDLGQYQGSDTSSEFWTTCVPMEEDAEEDVGPPEALASAVRKLVSTFADVKTQWAKFLTH